MTAGLNQFKLSCPECGNQDSLDVCAQVWVRIMPFGTDADESHDGSHIWDDQSQCHCVSCGWRGTVKQARG